MGLRPAAFDRGGALTPAQSLCSTGPIRDSREEDRVLFGSLVEEGLVELEHVETRDFWDRVREGRLGVFRETGSPTWPTPTTSSTC